jgi:hypothetical protein
LNKSPRGIWSDGFIIWVSDDGANRIFSYRIDGEALARQEHWEFTFKALLKSGNSDARGMWSDRDVIYVADDVKDRIFTYNMPNSIDARLASLTLSDVEIGAVSPDQTDYRAIAQGGRRLTTIEAEPVQEQSTLEILPVDADDDPSNGHQAELFDGQAISITVRSPDETRMLIYRVMIRNCLSLQGEERLISGRYAGGSVDDLVECARSFEINALLHYAEQTWVAYFIDAPEFLNRGLRARFPQGVAADEMFTVKRN